MVITEATRNRSVGLKPAREFESHRLRQSTMLSVHRIMSWQLIYFKSLQIAVAAGN